MQMKNTRVFRGGVTSNYLRLETNSCSSRANAVDETLDLTFRIKSKGGGVTSLLVQVGLEGIGQMMEEIAHAFPETLPTLLNGASIAADRLVDERRGR